MKSDLLSDLEFEFSLKPSDLEEFSHLLLGFQGKAIIWDDDAGEEKVVASIKGQRVDISLARKSFDHLQDLFDSISPEISDLGAHILSDNNCYLESFSKDEADKLFGKPDQTVIRGLSIRLRPSPIWSTIAPVLHSRKIST